MTSDNDFDHLASDPVSNKVRVTIEVDPDEVRRAHAADGFFTDPDCWSGPSARLMSVICRKVLEALPPPEPKFRPGDRVVRIRVGFDSPDAGRIGTVVEHSAVWPGRFFVLMDGDDKPRNYDQNALVRVVEDGDQ